MAKTSVYHKSHRQPKSGKYRSASGWSSFAKLTKAQRTAMFNREPVPTGLHCHVCKTYGHSKLALVNGKMACPGCAATGGAS